MTLKEFIKKHKIGKPDIRKSSACYADSDERMQYIRLKEDIDGFNYITISQNGLAKAREGKDELGKLEVVFDEEWGWKAQLPDSTEASDLDIDDDWD